LLRSMTETMRRYYRHYRRIASSVVS